MRKLARSCRHVQRMLLHSEGWVCTGTSLGRDNWPKSENIHQPKAPPDFPASCWTHVKPSTTGTRSWVFFPYSECEHKWGWRMGKVERRNWSVVGVFKPGEPAKWMLWPGLKPIFTTWCHHDKTKNRQASVLGSKRPESLSDPGWDLGLKSIKQTEL